METTTVEQATPVVAPEKNRVAKAGVEPTEGGLTFTFAGGEVRSVFVSKLSAEIRERALLYGIEQRLRQAYANAKSASDALGLFEKAMDNLAKGKWSGGRGSGEPKEDFSDLLARAIVRASAGLVPPQILDLAETKAMVKGLSRSEKAQFRAKPKVALAFSQIQIEEDSDESSL